MAVKVPRGQRWHNAIHEVHLDDGRPNILYSQKVWSPHEPKVKVKTGAHFLQRGGVTRPFNHRRLCKNEGKTMQNLQKTHWRTQEKTMENGAAQATSEGQNVHGAFQYKTGAYFMHMGVWHTKMAHRNWRSFLECHQKPQDTVREWTPLWWHICVVLRAQSLYNIYIYKNLATHLESEIVKTFLVLAQNGSHQNCPNFWVNSYPPGAHSGTVVAAPRNRRWGWSSWWMPRLTKIMVVPILKVSLKPIWVFLCVLVFDCKYL